MHPTILNGPLRFARSTLSSWNGRHTDMQAIPAHMARGHPSSDTISSAERNNQCQLKYTTSSVQNAHRIPGTDPGMSGDTDDFFWFLIKIQPYRSPFRSADWWHAVHKHDRSHHIPCKKQISKNKRWLIGHNDIVASEKSWRIKNTCHIHKKMPEPDAAYW